MTGKSISAIIAESKPIVLGLVAALVIAIASPGWAVELDFHDTTMTRGQTIDIPLYTQNVTGLGVMAYEVHFAYSTSALTPLDVIEAGTISESWGNAVWSVMGNQVRIVAAGITPLTGSGILCYIRMTAPLTGSGSSSLDLTFGMYNEGTPPVTLNDGYVTINNPQVITIYPNTATMTRGDSLLFYATGGTAPYTYSSTQPSVAAINPTTGWLRALSRGITRVAGVDDVGRRDTSDNIIVRDLKLTIRDTTFLSGQIVQLPVYVTDVTGLGILSGEFSLTWTSYQLEILDILEAGTLLESWGDVTYLAQPGRLDMSFAGTSPLSGAGILMMLRYRVTGVSSSTYVNFQNPLFNEVIEANTQRGNIAITPPPNLAISPNTATLVIDDSLQFTVGGGATPPLTWGTTDPIVASITSTGRLHALSPGEVFVTVVDAYGFGDSSGTITVCGFRIHVPYVESSADRAVQVPIQLVGNATGLDVMSLEMRLGYNQNIAWAQDVIQSGTMTESWWPAVLHTSPGVAEIAAAGTTPLTGGNSTMIVIEFYVASGASVGQYTNININYLLFNEGDVCGVPINGRITVVVGAPDPVTDLIIERVGANIRLSWSDVALRDGYNIYRYEDAGLSALDSTWLNVADQDPMTPGYQWTDPTADLGNEQVFFYIVKSFLN
jgi:uncharacterized protein YjdB